MKTLDVFTIKTIKSNKYGINKLIFWLTNGSTPKWLGRIFKKLDIMDTLDKKLEDKLNTILVNQINIMGMLVTNLIVSSIPEKEIKDIKKSVEASIESTIKTIRS